MASATGVWAQAGGGSLTGTVTDPGGAVIPNATVTLTNAEMGTNYSSISNSDGRYVFPQVAVGTYTLKVAATGFSQQIQQGVGISVGNTTTANVSMQIGQATQQVVVNGNVQQIQTESSDVGTTVSPKLIQQLPLSFSGLVRSPLQFMTLTPGFEGDASGNPQSQASFKLNGGGSGSADVLLDGASVSLASPNYQWNFGISVEAVNEFKVQTSTFPAEYGRTGGGFVNVATRSGGDQFHGGVYDLLKNKVFDANSWQNNHLGNAKPTDTQNDFGGFGGGPVFIPKLYDGRGKTFWFFSYEGFRYISVSHNTQSYPTPAMWQNGDFSALLPTQSVNGVVYPGRQLYDYTTCSGANLGKTCQPFVNNQIPTDRLDPLAKNYMALLPTPQITTRPWLNLNYSLSAPVNNDLYSIRIDQNIGQRNKLYGSFAQADMPVVDNYSIGPLFTNNFGSTMTHYVRLAEDWTITPNLLNHLNFGFTRRDRTEDGPNGIGQWEDKLGWHGDFVDILIPNMGIQYDPHGGNISTPPGDNGSFVDNSYEMDESLSWIHGNHTFQFGIGHRRQEFNVYYGSNAAADFSFENTLTSAGNNASGNPIDPNSGSGVASFFLGAATTGTVGGPQSAGMRARYWDFYGQDDWKATRKLTVNYGLRYEIPEPVQESQCRTSQVNPTLPNPGADNLPGAMEFQGKGTGRDGRCSPMNQYWGSWGPRLGAVYQLNNNTVVRAAYGIYYTALKVSNFANTDSAGFFAPGYKWPANVNQQTPAVIPSQVTSYPGVPPPVISPTALNGLNGGGGAATGGPVMLPGRLARAGAVQNWTLDIQRQLPGQWLLDAAYVGNHGSHLQALLKDPNVGPVSALSYGNCLSVLVTNQTTSPECAGMPVVPIPYTNFLNDFGSAATVAQALRPFPQYQTEDLDTSFSANPWGNYTYNALQVQLTKRYGAGLTVLANYTWSKNLTDADADYAPQEAWNGGSPAGLYNPANPKDVKSYSEFDQPQNAKIAYTYELPVGKGKKVLGSTNKAVDLAVGGWTIGGLVAYSTGFPLSVTESNWTSGIFAGQATGAQNRPNMVAGADVSGFRGGKYVFGQSRKVNPAAFTQSPNYTFGNAPRLLGGARNFAHKDEDLQIGKRFPLFTERVGLNFRFDAFNIFNRHSYGCLDNTVGDPGFGEFTCGTGPNAEVNNNISTSVPSSRTLQANFRITF
ncbi:TonB-dependent receptor domain-containing protein [Paracidobacterium acidisoli]|uniref:TonB-dependent receptor domain-containing protein n=1 Tax=Paracidobacterium acidisoli TaxID=2303751 RepID=UPI001313E42C|nr:TonB-dependent receptor [Paracidobacterium acidisoli]MBT9332371.1 TonB-dependent receptor [Paracidobacterium acidisoli]